MGATRSSPSNPWRSPVQRASSVIPTTRNLRSDTWESSSAANSRWDSPCAARKLKILGTDEVRAADMSLGSYNRVQLRMRPEDFVPRLACSDNDITLPWRDGYRATVRDEFAAVVSSGFDVRSRVREQLFQIERQQCRRVLDQRPYWTALVARTLESRRQARHGDLERRGSTTLSGVTNCPSIMRSTAAVLACRGIDISNFRFAWSTIGSLAMTSPEI